LIELLTGNKFTEGSSKLTSPNSSRLSVSLQFINLNQIRGCPETKLLQAEESGALFFNQARLAKQNDKVTCQEKSF
jgi:hypothetical protein